MPSIFETATKFLRRLASVCSVSVLHWLESLILVDEAPCGSGKCRDLCARLELELPHLQQSSVPVVTLLPGGLQFSVVDILQKNK